MVDYLDSELDSKIEGMLSPDCHPSHFNLTADFDKIVGKSREEIDTLNLTKYYTSELIGIKPGDNPPYATLDKTDLERTTNETMEFRDFGIKISKLREIDDVCDKEGIKFIAKFLAHYNFGKEQPGSIKPHVSDYIKGVLSQYKLKDLNIANMAKKAVTT